MKVDSKKKFFITLVSACAIAGALTFIFLSAVAIAARARQSDRYVEPDYVRYAAQGYSFETVSNKKSILFTVTNESSPVRIHLLTIDKDKHTLDILDIPPTLYTEADGFFGTLKEAFNTGVYKEIVSRTLAIKIDHKLSLSAESLATATELLGNTEVKISKALSAGKLILEKGTVCFDRSKAKDVILLPNAYLTQDGVLAYQAYLASMVLKTGEQGAVSSFGKLLGLILNSVSTDLMLDDIISLANTANKITLNKTNLYLLPGEMTVRNGASVYSIHLDSAAELLNQSFRVKGTLVSKAELCAPELSNSGKSFSVPQQITQYTP